MAVSYTSSGGGVTSNGTTHAHNLTLTAGVNLLLVWVAIQGSNTVTAATYNGVALTQLAQVANGTDVRIECWYLVNPGTGSALSLSVTLSAGATRYAVEEVGLTGYVSLGTAATNTGTGTAVSASATATSANDLVADGIGAKSTAAGNSTLPTATAGAGQTDRRNQETASGSSFNVRAAVSTEPGTAGAVAMDWTLSDSVAWASIAVPVLAAAAGGSTNQRLALLGVG